MKVALIGTHGVGKTTLCYELAARLKRRDVDVEIVREVARRCPLPINQATTVQAQEWILHTQMAWELEAAARHDLVLCDRSVLDNYCYLVHAVGESPVWDRVIDQWITSYHLLVHVPVCDEPRYDGVRAVDPGFQQEIGVLLDGMLMARGLAPLRLDPAARDHWGAAILDVLLPRLDPNLPLFPVADEDW